MSARDDVCIKQIKLIYCITFVSIITIYCNDTTHWQHDVQYYHIKALKLTLLTAKQIEFIIELMRDN